MASFFLHIDRVWTSHFLKIVRSLLRGLAGSVQTSWPLIWSISCKHGAIPCACKCPFLESLNTHKGLVKEGWFFKCFIYVLLQDKWNLFHWCDPGSKTILRKWTHFMDCVQWYIQTFWLWLHSSYMGDFLLKSYLVTPGGSKPYLSRWFISLHLPGLCKSEILKLKHTNTLGSVWLLCDFFTPVSSFHF
jgi:hypothetical protein